MSYDWDSLSGHSAAGWSEAQAEAGYVDSDTTDGDGSCSACECATALTEFMNQPLCWKCYEAIANGNVRQDTCSFADPGGNSALRAAGPGNPRSYPCPTCKEPYVLTAIDRQRGYQCDDCANGREY